jgi:hypothetical protein
MQFQLTLCDLGIEASLIRCVLQDGNVTTRTRTLANVQSDYCESVDV